jgi:uncharacterized membrane protein YdbT with pleckstrin-like domain
MTFLIEGEKIIKRFSQSRFVQIKLYLAAIVLFLVPLLYGLYFSNVKLPMPEAYVIAVPVAIGIILILIAETKKRLGSYYITNYRVISIRGSFKKTMDSCTYDKIVNVKTMQSLMQRLLGMGTIDITTYQRTEILLNSISNPTEIEKLIYSAMEKQGSQRGYMEEGMPAEQPYAQQPAEQKPRPQQPSYQQMPAYQPQPVYQPQNRPLLASERKLASQTAPGGELSAPPEKRKRFRIF